MNLKIVPEHLFEGLSLPRKELPVASKSRYRVYKNSKDFVLIEAENAKAALHTSGLKDATRIERENIYLTNILTVALTGIDSDAPKEQVTEQPTIPEAAPPTESAAATEPPKTGEAAPLSSEEVNKLLEK